MANAKTKTVTFFEEPFVSEFPGCCGVEVLHDLETETVTVLTPAEVKRLEARQQKLEKIDYYDRTQKEENELDDIQEELDQNENNEANIEDAGDPGYTTSLVLATTTARQKGAIALLKEQGFEVLTTFRNKGSGNTVTLWGLKR